MPESSDGHDPGERRALACDLLERWPAGRRAAPQVGRAVEQHEQHERPDGQQRDQLDDRFEGHRQHHAAMLLGGMHVAHAEQDGEHRHQAGDDQRGVGVDHAGAAVDPARRLGDGAEGRGHGLQLQRDVGQHAYRREQRGGDADGAALAVARGEEVGDRGDVVLLGQPHQLGDHRVAGGDHQHRPGVDQDEVEARRRRPGRPRRRRSTRCSRSPATGRRRSARWWSSPTTRAGGGRRNRPRRRAGRDRPATVPGPQVRRAFGCIQPRRPDRHKLGSQDSISRRCGERHAQSPHSFADFRASWLGLSSFIQVCQLSHVAYPFFAPHHDDAKMPCRSA